MSDHGISPGIDQPLNIADLRCGWCAIVQGPDIDEYDDSQSFVTESLDLFEEFIKNRCSCDTRRVGAGSALIGRR